MTITRTGHACRECGKPLTDRISKLFGVGPDCRRTMTDTQLQAAMRQTRAEADPGYIPPDRPASLRARRNNAQARATVARAQEPAKATCVHGGKPGACPMCRRDNDPWRAAERIIAEIQQERCAARDAAWRAWQAAHAEQLTLEST